MAGEADSDLGIEARAGVLRLTIRREERRNALGHAVLAGLTDRAPEWKAE